MSLPVGFLIDELVVVLAEAFIPLSVPKGRDDLVLVSGVREFKQQVNQQVLHVRAGPTSMGQRTRVVR